MIFFSLIRFTIKCPKLPENFKTTTFSEQENVGKLLKNKNHTPKELAMISDVKSRLSKTNTLNKRRFQIDDILQSKLTDVCISNGRTFETDGNGKQITGTIDGTVIVSCSNTLLEVEKLIIDEGFEIQPDKSYVKHNGKTLKDGTSEEDIDEVFEPLTDGELKKLKSRKVTNQFKAKMVIQ